MGISVTSATDTTERADAPGSMLGIEPEAKSVLSSERISFTA